MLLIIIIVTKIVLCVGQTGMRILGYLYYLLVNAPPGLPPGGEEGFTYLMGLNMAFPKSENLRTSFRWTPLGFTTRRGRRVMSKPRTVTQLINSVFFCYLRRLQRQHALQSLRANPAMSGCVQKARYSFSARLGRGQIFGEQDSPNRCY